MEEYSCSSTSAGVVESPNEGSATLKFLQKTLVIDVETKCFRGCIEIGAVNEYCDALMTCHGVSRAG